MTYQNTLAVLADPTRRTIFETLVTRGPMAVGALAGELPVSRPAVSQHLAALGDAGLVTADRMGTRRLYSARREGLADLRVWVETMWGDVLSAFAGEIERENQK